MLEQQANRSRLLQSSPTAPQPGSNGNTQTCSVKDCSVFEETKIPNSHYMARLKPSGVWLCKYGTLVLCVFCSFTMSEWLTILTLSATASGHLCQKPESLGSSNSDEEPSKLGGKESTLSLHQLFLWSCCRERWLTVTNTGR